MRDPTGSGYSETPPGIFSIRDAGFEHQAHAMSKGYNSVAELLIDEMVTAIRDLQERMTAVEQQVQPSSGEIEETF